MSQTTAATNPSPSRADVRSKIVEAAARILRDEGPAAVTTRGVAEAAGVQAPTIYRLFGDKDGLLEAVAEHVMAAFVSDKAAIVEAAAVADVDPLDDLRAGWEAQIAFGLANPTLFALLSDPSRVVASPAARSGRRVLEARVRRIAETGRLRVSESRAVSLIQSAGVGVIQTLLATPPDQRDAGLADALYDAVLRQMLVDPSPRATDRAGAAGAASAAGAGKVASAADTASAVSAATVTLRAFVPQLDGLTAAERELLTQWLDRAVAAR